MRRLFIVTLIALAAAPTAAFAVPMCDGPGLTELGLEFKFGSFTEQDDAQQAEIRLRQHGINAHQTRFWNGCIQTFVSENGHETMRFYDPRTLEEVPTN